MEQTNKRRRGIFLLPNLFTTGTLFAGFYAIVAAMNGRFEAAAVSIYIAMVLDSLDGRIARLTNTQSAFGAEYDSLADLCAFGLAPSLVLYQWHLVDLGKVGWLAAFIYTAGTALRLARFNTQVGIADKRYFQGLPSPAAAAVTAGMVWVGENLGLREYPGITVATMVISVMVALLMVSRIRYNSFKELDLRGRVPFVAILVMVLVFVVVAIHPAVLFVLVFAYALSGPTLTLARLRHHRAARRKTPPGESS
ncbi:MAG: CDP-diacylglycerol--serine O-phosphatidyltransferase [Gammaproteobacteria bacterium]|nr:CDP-diacylglycerol--serine O-phosphatidyltransferase [Gammaproteobacteria bacterium]